MAARHPAVTPALHPSASIHASHSYIWCLQALAYLLDPSWGAEEVVDCHAADPTSISGHTQVGLHPASVGCWSGGMVRPVTHTSWQLVKPIPLFPTSLNLTPSLPYSKPLDSILDLRPKFMD